MTYVRCFGTGDELYERYHDEEWGRPVADSLDERELFERISLEGFQAGLSWITILRKREAFRTAFADFTPATVAHFDKDDIARLMSNQGIVRNQMKIAATITNARALLDLHDRRMRLREIIAEYTPQPRTQPPSSYADLPTSTPESIALSKRLKALGFRFVGPTTMYASMQALGYVNDHLQGCWLAIDSSADEHRNFSR